MKIFGLIFGLIGILLSGFPCCSIDSCDEAQSHEIHSEAGNEDSELCSPFMSCGACPGFVISISNFTEESEILTSNLRKLIDTYTPILEPEFIDRLWQPPRFFTAC